MSDMIQIVVVDDHPLFRHGLVQLLNSEPSFTVCGEASNGPEAIKKAQDLKPDFVLLDLRLPGMNGIETATALKAILPQTKLVLFSAYADSLGNCTWASAIGVDLVVPKGSLIDMAASLKTLAKSA